MLVVITNKKLDTFRMPITVDEEKVAAVGDILNDKQQSLAERFRALFTLRNIGGQTAIDSITACFGDPSALLKHELAYCLGQMQDTYAIPALAAVLKDVTQEPMVRHEAGIVAYIFTKWLHLRRRKAKWRRYVYRTFTAHASKTQTAEPKKRYNAM